MFRWVAIFAVACVFASGCDDDATPVSPGTLPVTFSAVLSPANEVPPIANSEQGAQGTMQVQFNVTRDAAGAITAATADFYLSASALAPNTTLIGAHIHNGAAGVNGPVLVSTGLTTALTKELPDGRGELVVRGVVVQPSVAQGNIDNPSGYYFNIHSPTNPSGFVRGQLRRVQ